MKIWKNIKRVCEEFIDYAGPGITYFLVVLTFWVTVISAAVYMESV